MHGVGDEFPFLYVIPSAWTIMAEIPCSFLHNGSMANNCTTTVRWCSWSLCLMCTAMCSCVLLRIPLNCPDPWFFLIFALAQDHFVTLRLPALFFRWASSKVFLFAYYCNNIVYCYVHLLRTSFSVYTLAPLIDLALPNLLSSNESMSISSSLFLPLHQLLLWALFPLGK